MKPAKISGKHAFLLMAAGFLLIPQLVFAQGAPGEEKESYRLKEAEIRGELKDVLGKMRLLESEIIGTLERPRLSYSLPWKDAFLPIGPERDFEGDLLGDPFPLIDPGSFEQDINLKERGLFLE